MRLFARARSLYQQCMTALTVVARSPEEADILRRDIRLAGVALILLLVLALIVNLSGVVDTFVGVSLCKSNTSLLFRQLWIEEMGSGGIEKAKGTLGVIEGQSVVILEGFARVKMLVSRRHCGGAADAGLQINL